MVKWTAQAKIQLRHIHDSIAHDSPLYAKRVSEEQGRAQAVPLKYLLVTVWYHFWYIQLWQYLTNHRCTLLSTIKRPRTCQRVVEGSAD